MVTEVPCYLCGEEVVNGDDYKIHVEIAHGVEYEEEIYKDTSNKVTTSANAVDENKVSGEGSDVKSTNRKTFFDMFDAKIKQIMDLAEGRIEPVSVEDDNVEIFDEKQIWQMFENVKTKVMNMDISETVTPTKNIVKEQILNDDFESPSIRRVQEVKERKWYQGTFYDCKLCRNSFFGQKLFRQHLNRNHKFELSSLQNLTKFAFDFEEKLYTCRICEKKMKHEFKNIYMHLRSNHSLTIDAYETQFIIDVKCDGEISNNHLPQPGGNLSKQEKQNAKLYPIKSELPISNQPHPLGPLRPVKSHAVKLRTVKSQVPDFQADQGTFREPLQPVATTSTETSPNNDAPTVSNPDPPMVKEELLPIPTPKALSFYYCPIPDCSFYTTKEGMKKGQAALHLKNDHKIKAKDMKPGMYKFDEIKV